MAESPAKGDEQAARRARMLMELDDEGIGTGQDVPQVRELVVEELVHARYIKVHEGIWPPYGVIIADPKQMQSLEATLMDVPADSDTIDKFANGLDTFVVRDPNNPAFRALWNPGPSDELSLLRFAERAKAVIIQRLPDSSLKTISDKRIWVNAGYSWWSRPVARSRVRDVRASLDISSGEELYLLTQLLEFAFHRLSPRGIGATLVWDVAGSAEFPHESTTDPGVEPPFTIDFHIESHLQMMTTYLSGVDGACFINSSGLLVRAQVKLQASSEAAIFTEPEGGTRHSSAKRFSFDHDGAIVIVVSADGPVTLYSNGRASEVLKAEEPQIRSNSLDFAPTQRPITRAEVIVCPSCKKRLVIEIENRVNRDSEQVVTCPVCRSALPPVTAYAVWTRPAMCWTEVKPSRRSRAK